MADPFHTTHWSVVLAAGQESQTDASSRALETLCQTYWYPLYAFIRHRVGNEHEAQDLTQAFFERLLEKRTLADADPDRGRFRAFLLTACNRFLANEWHKANAQKRGGGVQVLSLDFEAAATRYSVEPADNLTAEVLFEQQWAIALIDSVLARLRQEFADRGAEEPFDQLKTFLTRGKTTSYAAVAEVMETSEGAAKVAVYRLRTRYREMIRSEIAQTVDSPDEVEDEIRRLFEVMSGKRDNSV
ncbi:MAG: sigma-70 family RNA polymerase sigma factor [Fuerstiella sp.]